MSDIEVLQRMAVALAVGLVIGFERGWQVREAPEGTRVAGLRTLALIGFAGGLVAVLGTEFTVLVAGVVTLGLAGFLVAIRLMTRSDPDIDATTEVASIVTFSLGALGVAMVGSQAPDIEGHGVSAEDPSV